MPQQLKAAISLARIAHAGQVDKAGNPVIDHALGVMKDLSLQGLPEDYLIVGVLHDVVEDTEVSLDDLRRMGYSDAVINAVDAISRSGDEKYFDYILRVKENSIARVVKIADNRNNLERMDSLSEEKAGRLKERYVKSIQILSSASWMSV